MNGPIECFEESLNPPFPILFARYTLKENLVRQWSTLSGIATEFERRRYKRQIDNLFLFAIYLQLKREAIHRKVPGISVRSGQSEPSRELFGQLAQLILH